MALRNKYRIAAFPSWVPGGWNGHTIPPFGILIRRNKIRSVKLIKHEITHWHQYERMGLVLFYVRYLSQMIVFGYYNSPMEKEARKFQSRILK